MGTIIKTFSDQETENLFQRKASRRIPPDIQRAAFRKLRMLNQSVPLEDVKVPPGNRLEPLEGNRKGQYSIRINDQWRICFTWRGSDAYDVEITDYHS